MEWCPLTDGHMTMRCLMTKFQVQENEASIALELEYKKLLQKKKKTNLRGCNVETNVRK